MEGWIMSDIRTSALGGIPFGGTAGRPANAINGQPYFNGDVGRLEIYASATGWQNIVQETPGISTVSGVYNESAGSGTFIISGTNFNSGAITYAIGTNGVQYEATSTTVNSIVQVTALFSNLSAAYEPYDIKIVNTSNLFGLLADAFYINDSPIWATTSGSLGTWSGSNIQLSTTDDESNTITYSVTSGSLPTGLSLSSAGLISGTNTATSGTYPFTVSASDGSNTAVTRSFNIIIPIPTLSGGTLSSDSTYYYRTFTGTGNLVVSGSPATADVLMIAGGGGGGKHSGAGGGAGGVAYKTLVSIPVGSSTATIGSGGLGRNLGPYATDGGGTGNPGTNTTFLTYTANGGGAGGFYGSLASDLAGGSGGGGSRESNNGGAATQPNSATGGYGNAGGSTLTNGSGTDYPGHGGGGAGAAGGLGSASGRFGGAGGAGLNTWSTWASATSTGVSGYYAGGGGGNIQYTVNAGGAGGSGGGGTGGGGDGSGTNQVGRNGVANTGSGGGGNNYNASPSDASSSGHNGNGGSGLVIVRYTKASVGG
jgi:hypothetical protein